MPMEIYHPGPAGNAPPESYLLKALKEGMCPLAIVLVCQDSFGDRSLIVAAAEFGMTKVMDYIITNQKSIIPAGQFMKSAKIAYAANSYKILKIFFEKGILRAQDLNRFWKDDNNRAPIGLHQGVYFDASDSIRVLCEHGVDPRGMDHRRMTALHFAAQLGNIRSACALLESCPAEKKEVFVNMFELQGDSALHIAAAKGHADLCALLLQHGADPSRCGERTVTPLYWASKYGQLPAVKVLVEAGAPLDSKNSTGFTPLIGAVSAGHKAIVQYLLSKMTRAQINMECLAGKTAIDTATKADIAAIVRKAGGRPGSGQLQEDIDAERIVRCVRKYIKHEIHIGILRDDVFIPLVDHTKINSRLPDGLGCVMHYLLAEVRRAGTANWSSGPLEGREVRDESLNRFIKALPSADLRRKWTDLSPDFPWQEMRDRSLLDLVTDQRFYCGNPLIYGDPKQVMTTMVFNAALALREMKSLKMLAMMALPDTDHVRGVLASAKNLSLAQKLLRLDLFY